jgi:hypothetical protein
MYWALIRAGNFNLAIFILARLHFLPRRDLVQKRGMCYISSTLQYGDQVHQLLR